MNNDLKNMVEIMVNEQLKEHKYKANENETNVGSENAFNGIVINKLVGRQDIYMALEILIPKHIQNDDIVYLCIGTDRSTGDSLGPLVGMYLEGMGYKNVYGTIDNPVHAMNLQETVYKLPKNKKVIAIDACLGRVMNVGTTQVIKGSITPGAGVNKKLLKCGDYSISSIVNTAGFLEYMVLQNTRLSLVMKLAKDITSALIERFPLEYEKENIKIKNIKDKDLVKRIKKKGLSVELITK